MSIHAQPPVATPEIEQQIAAAEVYVQFYDQYGSRDFVDSDGARSVWQIVRGQVVHFDDTADRSTHLVVHDMDGRESYRSALRYDDRGEPYYYHHYKPTSFMVASCNGVSLERWNVERAHGIYAGRINDTDRQVKPDNERLFLTLQSEEHGRSNLTIRRIGGLGTLELGSGQLGWVLDRGISRRERDRVLNPLTQPRV